MSSRKNHIIKKRIHLTLSEQTVGLISELVNKGGFGNNPTQVATYLLQQKLGELIESNTISRKDL